MSLVAFQAIRDRFQTLVATPNALPVVHDNAPEPNIAANWCRFSIRVDSTQQVSMGERRFRMRGAATAILFGPIVKGDASVTTLGEDVIAAFRGVQIASPYIAFSPAPSFTGTADRDESWIRRTVTIPFRFDEVDP